MAQKEGTSDLQHNGFSADHLMNGDTDMAISSSELDNMFEKEPNLLSKEKVPAPWFPSLKMPTPTFDLGDDETMGIDDDMHFLVMEVYGGGDLADAINAQQCSTTNPISGILHDRNRDPNHFSRFLAQISVGLEGLHRMGIVHRDVKPHNVFLSGEKDQDGHVKLDDDTQAVVADLGLAIEIKLDQDTPLGTRLKDKNGNAISGECGTPKYIPLNNEWCHATDAIPSTPVYSFDQFSLGSLVHDMACILESTKADLPAIDAGKKIVNWGKSCALAQDRPSDCEFRKDAGLMKWSFSQMYDCKQLKRPREEEPKQQEAMWVTGKDGKIALRNTVRMQLREQILTTQKTIVKMPFETPDEYKERTKGYPPLRLRKKAKTTPAKEQAREARTAKKAEEAETKKKAKEARMERIRIERKEKKERQLELKAAGLLPKKPRTRKAAPKNPSPFALLGQNLLQPPGTRLR